jgi:hypothetical protein
VALLILKTGVNNELSNKSNIKNGNIPNILIAESLSNIIFLIFPETKYRSNVWLFLSDKIDSIKKLLGAKELRKIKIKYPALFQLMGTIGLIIVIGLITKFKAYTAIP